MNLTNTDVEDGDDDTLHDDSSACVQITPRKCVPFCKRLLRNRVTFDVIGGGLKN